MEPDAILKCLKHLRPYHGILLLQDENTLLELLPLDSTPSVTYIRVTRNFIEISIFNTAALSLVLHR